ncbi:hypothetical protein VTJ83DRAFT_5243 [Remersonia thermophila]|uniref:Glucose-methanol-choline oxidoreductase N-terminal domain-containing protein n=1 Tax=Remersonia thermophila TaxID=72144 RepID=A0ABR4DDR8_9PEZI
MSTSTSRSGEEFAKLPFDFLVVGGGTAGLTVAARLSEQSHLLVGVLEAGPLSLADEVVNCPGLAGRGLDTELDWKFKTTPQPGLGGRSMSWARGKVLGGSSALNYMTWNRAAKQDYDDWRDLGNAGWGWDEMLPFFKKTETFHRPTESIQQSARAELHEGAVGYEGPIQVSYPKEYSESHKLWHDSLNAAGVRCNDDHLSGNNTGCWTSVVSVDPENSTRSYAANAYYWPVASRRNLVVLTDAQVNEIILAENSSEREPKWKAKGVRFSCQGASLTAYVSREVIVSAGSIQSPQILELSGIGNKSVLSAAGIAVKVENPNVGENLQDHLTTTLVFDVDPSFRNPDDLKISSVLDAAREEYTTSQTGPLTVVPVSMAYVPAAQFMANEVLERLVASLSPSSTKQDADRNDREEIRRRRFASRAADLGHVEYVFDLGDWGVGSPVDSSGTKKYASMLQILQYPFSTGSVHIRQDKDGQGSPLCLAIDPQYFAGDHGHLDLDIAVHAHRFAERICSAAPLASILREQVWPVPGTTETDEELREWLRSVLTTDWHPVGTCAMGGTAGPRGGVVDERLRVYGVIGLRVVDASIMPVQISAHLQATVYAIAEKAAAMISEDWERCAKA